MTVSRPSAPQVYQCKMTKSSCMATQLCSPKKYNYPTPLPPPTHGGHFALDPHPWNYCNFSTWLGTLWKGYFRKKKLLHYIFMGKRIFCDKMRKIFSFMLTRCLMNSRTFSANNQPCRRYLTLLTTRIMSSAKEQFTFRLHVNTTWTFITSLVITCYKKA